MSESSMPPGGGLRLPTEPTVAAPAPGAGTAAGSGAGATSPAGVSQPTFPEPMLPGRAELPRGASIGRYLVIEKLGAGGMGVVYAAYDPELDRRVAIKLLHADGLEFGSSFGRTRLMREAQAMARLAHPNVVAVYDIGTFGDRVFIAMEHIEGGTLTAWLNKEQHSRQDILKMFIAAGHGLAAAHAAGLVHRDFKPDTDTSDAEQVPGH